MDLGLFQQQSIKTVMTQELRQAIKILQLSKTELIQYIQEKSLENPLIDLQEPVYESDGEHYGTGRVQGSDGYNPFDFIGDVDQGLKDDLLQQARYLNFNERTYKQLAYLILQLDEDGYLPGNIIEETAETLRISEDAAQDLLAQLQKLDPPGIGARNLRECLLLQADRHPQKNELARAIVTNHLSMLAKKQWRELASELSVSLNEVKKAVQWIQQLQPKPGSLYKSNQKTHFIKPDLTITKTEGRFVVNLNEDYIPKIRLNPQYDHLLKNKSDSESWIYMNNKRREMIWLTKCIEQRRETILNVAKVIVKNQKGFLENGFAGLKPMTQKNVADELGIHESTVSRAVRNKNVQTPFGLYEMKIFFASKLSTSSGKEVSSSSVKWLIKGILETENEQKPLSDQKIANLLKTDHGITVSRRTVAKYRGQLHIPASARRKS